VVFPVLLAASHFAEALVESAPDKVLDEVLERGDQHARWIAEEPW